MSINSAPEIGKTSSGYPGVGSIIWLSLIAFSAFATAYIRVCDETIGFMLGLMFEITIPVLVIIFVVIPIFLLAIAVRRLCHGNRKAAAAFVAVPLAGLAMVAVLNRGFEWLLLEYKIVGYQRAIDAARITGKDVLTKDVSINLGPPITASFSIPQMMWSDDAIVYTENDQTSTAFDKECLRSFRPLGSHFYWRSGIC
ncbi:MAG: hypothetical protein JO001_03565 [Alphaproteobacteria bacterium]|nr:hypothetical protein [Alphaproteobacteria bacterium]